MAFPGLAWDGILRTDGFLAREEDLLATLFCDPAGGILWSCPIDRMEVVGGDHSDDAGDGNLCWEGNRWEGKRTSTPDTRFETGRAATPMDLCATLEAGRADGTRPERDAAQPAR